MNILISVSNLNIGGPTKFLLRLSKELSKENNLYIYDFYPYLKDINIQSKEYSEINFISVKDKRTDRINWKINSLLKKINTHKKYWIKSRNKHFEKSLSKHKIDIVLSTQKEIDYIVSPIVKKKKIPFVIRLNSDYGINEKELSKSKEIIENLDGIVYTADFHYFNLKNKVKFPKSIEEVKIMNGVNMPLETHSLPKGYHLKDDSLIFGMVARGIKEKGWEECILAFLKLVEKNNELKTDLILVGSGKYLDKLKTKYNHPKIHFVGSTDNPFEWIKKFDICVLPTYFNNESTPNSLIEYLICGKPVISTNYVEIPYMMSYGDKIAGKLIDLKDGLPNYFDIYKYMNFYIENKSQIMIDQKTAIKASEKFNLKKCTGEYLKFFKKIKYEKFN
jgi:glycosyltransferase involved in cell wall biosynthesis